MDILDVSCSTVHFYAMLVVTLFINVGICARAIKLSACFECDFGPQQSLQQHCIEGVRGRPHLLGTLLSLCDGTLLDLPARAFLDLCDGTLVDLRSGPHIDLCARTHSICAVGRTSPLLQ